MNSQLVLELIIALSTVASTAIVSYVVIKVTLARHDERISNMKKDINEMKSERNEMSRDTKNMMKLINNINTTVAVLDERTKKE